MQVLLAESGPKAIEMLHRAADLHERFDLVLLDMQMPEMDGLTMAKIVKADPDIADTKMILLTSLGRASGDLLAEGGIAMCLTKPVKESALYDALASVVGSGKVPHTAHPGKTMLSGGEGPGEVKKSIRVLVAEDNPVNQKVALRMLKKLGVRADVVANGREAVEALKSLPYDLVFMDCNMPEMDGFDATTAIRREEGNARHTVIIAMTANALQGDRERCIGAGMDDYIAKPVDQVDLEGMLKRWGNGSGLVGNGHQEMSSHAIKSPPAPSVDPERLAELAELSDEDDPLWLRSVATKFMEDVTSRIVRIKAAIETKDPAGLREVAHALKGSTSNIGAGTMAVISQRLQAVAQAGSVDGAQELLVTLEEEFERVKQELNAHLSILENVK
jgi:CheY-like chemotaxis protein